MLEVNQDYLKLRGSYLFSEIGKRVNAYAKANPDKKIIRLGIGDVTKPLPPVVIDALHKAVDEMANEDTFRGYAPDLGYEFLRNAISDVDYKRLGCDIAPDEILYPMVQNVIREISRKSLALIILSQFAIRFTQCM